MTTQYTKKQHYVPQFLLSRFKNMEGKIWVVDGKSEPREQQGTSSICQGHLLYSKPKLPGSGIPVDNSLEDRLGEEIESSFGNVLKRIDKGEVLENDKECILLFVSTLLTRNPLTLEKSNEGGKKLAEDIIYAAVNSSSFIEFKKEYFQLTLTDEVEESEWLAIKNNPDKALEEAVSISQLSMHQVNQEWNEEVIFKGAEEIRNLWGEVDVIVHIYNANRLIISDNPVLFKRGSPTEEKLLPLSSNILLQIKAGTGQYSIVPNSPQTSLIEKASNWIKSNRVRWLISADKDLLL